MMRQAIETKFLGPTNHRGSRVKATACAGSITVPWDYSYGAEDNHVFAARALALKLSWTAARALALMLSWTDGHGFDDWVGGSTNDGYVFVYAVPSAK